MLFTSAAASALEGLPDCVDLGLKVGDEMLVRRLGLPHGFLGYQSLGRVGIGLGEPGDQLDIGVQTIARPARSSIEEAERGRADGVAVRGCSCYTI